MATKTRKLLDASQLSDFQPGRDKVVREGNRTYVVNNTGEYKKVEVQSDVMLPEYINNIQKLTPEQKVKMIDAVKNTPYLSEEGRKERLALLQTKRKTYDNGYLIPIEGDKVTQIVSGPFGTPAYISGIVKKNRDGELRVVVEDSGSYLGIGAGPKAGKSYDVNRAWVVDGDPEIKRREEAKKAREEEANRPYKEYLAKKAEAEKAYSIPTKEIKLGMKIKDMVNDRVLVVTEINDDGAVFASEDQLTGGGFIGGGKRMGSNIVDTDVKGYTIVEQPTAAIKNKLTKIIEIKADYDKVLDATNRISATHREKTEKYRARQISDAEYLESRKLFDKAQKDFDDAESTYKERMDKLEKDTVMPTEPPKQAETTTDEIFIRQTKASEKANPSRYLAQFPEKEGYRKVYKPYGAQGRGYYYVLDQQAETTTPAQETPKDDQGKLPPKFNLSAGSDILTSYVAKQIAKYGYKEIDTGATKELNEAGASYKVWVKMADGSQRLFRTRTKDEADKITAYIKGLASGNVATPYSPVKLPSNDLQEVQNQRSPLSKSLDNAQLHKKVISPESKQTVRWKKDPGAFDVIGIDTPSGKGMVNFPKNKTVKVKTPKAPKLKSVKKNKIYHTKVGRGTLLSRRPVGRKRR